MKKQITGWYLEQLDEVPGLEYKVEKRDSTMLVLSSQTPEAPELFSVNVSLSDGFITLESPVKVRVKENSLKLLILSTELRSYLSVRKMDEKLLPVLCLDLRVSKDFKIDKVDFHRELSHFFTDYHALSGHLSNQHDKPDNRNNYSHEPQKGDIEDQDKEVGFQL